MCVCVSTDRHRRRRVAPRRSWVYHLAVLLLHLCLSAPVSPPAASPLPAHSARSSGLQLRRDGQRSREAAGGEGGSGLPPPGHPVRSLRPDDAAKARGALDADADSEAATGAGFEPPPTTRLGKGLLCQAPPSFASRRHVSAVIADLQHGGLPRTDALALLSGTGGASRQPAEESEDMLNLFGRSLVGIVLELSPQDAASAAFRSDRLAAMRTLSEWLQHCRAGSRAAEDIMDGLTAALATLVLSDSSARQKEKAGPPPLLAVPQ
jgi:hypothetical protein